MSLFVAIPAYDRKIGGETASSLLSEQALANNIGLELKVGILPGCSLITQARNQLCKEFLDSGAAKMIFVDADVSWEPGALLKLASQPVEVVGGAYRYKDATGKEGYPVGWLPGPLMATDGLIEVASVPGGFLSISRRALESFKRAFPARTYRAHDEDYFAFFTAPHRDGYLFGEDGAFCHDYRLSGGQIWLDPELTLTHHDGQYQYKGKIGDYLKVEAAKKKAAANPVEVPEIVQA